MRTGIIATAILAFVAAGVSAKEMNTRERVAELGRGLSDAWIKYNLDSQKVTRQQTFQDLNSVFTREITNANVPPNEKLIQAAKAYIANLEKATEYFKVEKMKAERSTYLKACTQALKRETQKAVDYAESRTTQDVYKFFVNMLEEACDTFVQERSKDQRQEAINGFQQMFIDLLKDAKVPEGVDHADLMDQNIKDARQRFPTTTPALAQKNSTAMQAIENAAKQVKQRSIRK